MQSVTRVIVYGAKHAFEKFIMQFEVWFKVVKYNFLEKKKRKEIKSPNVIYFFFSYNMLLIPQLKSFHFFSLNFQILCA